MASIGCCYRVWRTWMLLVLGACIMGKFDNACVPPTSTCWVILLYMTMYPKVRSQEDLDYFRTTFWFVLAWVCQYLKIYMTMYPKVRSQEDLDYFRTTFWFVLAWVCQYLKIYMTMYPEIRKQTNSNLWYHMLVYSCKLNDVQVAYFTRMAEHTWGMIFLKSPTLLTLGVQYPNVE